MCDVYNGSLYYNYILVNAGKYNNGIPTGSRAADKSYQWLVPRIEEWKKEGKIDKVNRSRGYNIKLYLARYFSFV